MPIYETSSAEQVEWNLGDSGAVAAILETPAHSESLESVRKQLRAVPGNGFGYGALRHLGSPDVRAKLAETGPQRVRIQKEMDQLAKVIASSERQLGDEKFMSRAPAHVVNSIREKLGGYKSQFTKLQESLQ